MEKSKKYRLNISDAIKGAIVTCLGIAAGLITESQGAEVDFLNAFKIGAISGIVYLFKNLFEDEQGVI